MPTVGVLPVIFAAVPLQITWSIPAADGVGAGSGTFIITSSVETAQGPLEIVHLKV